VQLKTAKNYLLLIERIGKKPMLRTRFTAQAYFVFGALLDLMDQDILEIDDSIEIADQSKFDGLPPYLDGLKQRITESIDKDDDLVHSLDMITSWDIANEIYDGVGEKLLAEKLVEEKSVKTNLDTHTIYLPTDDARAQVVEYLSMEMQSSTIEGAAISLVVILEQMDALKWLFSDKEELANLTNSFRQNMAGNSVYEKEKQLVKTAQDIITKKKFWFDSWLS
jgi:hypothetical protein